MRYRALGTSRWACSPMSWISTGSASPRRPPNRPRLDDNALMESGMKRDGDATFAVERTPLESGLRAVATTLAERAAIRS